jgi:ABC-2 type transport system permease protein
MTDLGWSKYLAVMKIAWRRELEERLSFILARSRGLTVLFSLYFLWSALLGNEESVFQYSRSQILTYVLGMNILRALVLWSATDNLPSEIVHGQLSDLLLRPIRPIGYWAARDVAAKGLQLSSAVVEVALFALVASTRLYLPHRLLTWVAFLASLGGAIVLYFMMSYCLGLAAFWTSQSRGPRFCFDLVLEFSAGAYFPIDVLSSGWQAFLSWLPFPYLIFYPLNIYLDRVGGAVIARTLCTQAVWIGVLWMMVNATWRRGMRTYAAEGV